MTQPNPDKAGAYSWLKAPRYANKPHEVGPLARMWVNGDYTHGISAMDRIQARAAETKKIADAMDGWLDQLLPGQPTYAPSSIPASDHGSRPDRGAARRAGPLDGRRRTHVISRYQVVTPTSWNAAPMDDQNQRGPIEQALIGTPVPDIPSRSRCCAWCTRSTRAWRARCTWCGRARGLERSCDCPVSRKLE